MSTQHDDFTEKMAEALSPRPGTTPPSKRQTIAVCAVGVAFIGLLTFVGIATPSAPGCAVSVCATE